MKEYPNVIYMAIGSTSHGTKECFGLCEGEILDTLNADSSEAAVYRLDPIVMIDREIAVRTLKTVRAKKGRTQK